MSDRKFRTNAEMARHYFFELLDDGIEHSVTEITGYVFDKTDKRGVSGGQLTQSMISSAIRGYFLKDEKTYIQTRRGFYKKRDVSVSVDIKTEVHGLITKVLRNAKNDINRCFIIDVSKLNASAGEITELQKLSEHILAVLSDLIDYSSGGDSNE